MSWDNNHQCPPVKATGWHSSRSIRHIMSSLLPRCMAHFILHDQTFWLDCEGVPGLSASLIQLLRTTKSSKHIERGIEHAEASTHRA